MAHLWQRGLRIWQTCHSIFIRSLRRLKMGKGGRKRRARKNSKANHGKRPTA